MFEIFNIILQMSLKASIVIIAILIVRFFLKRAPKKFSYMLWSIAAFRLLMPFSFESFFSIFRFTEGFAEKNITYTPNSNIVPNAQNTPNFNTNVTQPHIQTIPNTQRPLGDVSNMTSDVPISDVTAQTISEEIDIASVIGNIVAWIWVIGMAALVIYGIVSYIKLKRRMDNAILFDNNVFLSDRISSPFTLGFVKPRIYLPFGLSETETKCILAHEKAHIKRLDHIIKPISFLLLSVHWFNPLCWIAFNRMAFDMEMSCDEAVLQKSNDVDIKKNYSRTLLALAIKQRFPAPSPIAFNDGGGAKSRIKHTLSWKKPKIWISIISIIVCIATLVACLSDYTSGKYDFDGEPYILEYSSNDDGTCYVSNILTNFEYEKSFEVVIPEKSPDGDTVIGIKISESNALNNFESFNVPKYILAEDMNKIIDAINAFDGEALDIIQNEKSTERVSKIFLTFYALHKAPDNAKIEYYLIDEHITKEEHERLSAILTHYAEYDEKQCFSDSEKCLEDITGFENLEGRVFDFFYHSAKNIKKIIIPKAIEIIDDGIREELKFEIIYEYADSGEQFSENDTQSSESKPEENAQTLTINLVDDDFEGFGDFDVFVDTEATNTDMDIVITVSGDIETIGFLAINPDFDVKDGFLYYEIEDVLYLISDLNKGKSMAVSTYINDTVTTRGIATVDAYGVERYYAIEYNMSGNGAPLYLTEFLPSNEPEYIEEGEVFLAPIESPIADDDVHDIFIDPKSGNDNNAKVLEFHIDAEIDDFCFFELIYNDGYELGESFIKYSDFLIYDNKEDDYETGWVAFVKTIIPEGNATRGISYIDSNGEFKYFGIFYENNQYVLKEIECRDIASLIAFHPYLQIHDKSDINVYQVRYFDEDVVVITNEDGFVVVDTNGKVISDAYDIIYPFKDGKAFAYDKSRKAYYLNTKGKIIKELNDEEIRDYFSYYLDTKTEIYRERVGLFETRYGVRKKDGTVLTEPIFEYIKTIDQEYNFAMLSENQKPVFIDKEGNILQYLPEGLVDGYKTDTHIYGSYSETEWCLFDTSGNLLNETRFIDIGSFENGFATVIESGVVDDLLGIIDENGNIIIPPCLEVECDAVDIYNGKIAYLDWDRKLRFADIVLEDEEQ